MTDAGQPQQRLPDAGQPTAPAEPAGTGPEEEALLAEPTFFMDPRWDLLCRDLDAEVASATLYEVMDALQRLYFQVPILSVQEMRDQLAHIDCLLQQALYPVGPDVG